MDWKYFASALPHQINAAPSGITKNARRGFFSHALTIDPDNFFVPLMTQLLKVSTKQFIIPSSTGSFHECNVRQLRNGPVQHGKTSVFPPASSSTSYRTHAPSVESRRRLCSPRT